MANDREKSIKQAREELRAAGYRCINHHILRDGNVKTGDIWFYANGREVVVVNAIWEGTEHTGWDIYVPLTDSPKTEDTFAAIRARAVREVA